MSDQILHALDEEIEQLRRARAILALSSRATPAGKSAKASTHAVAGTKPRRTLSAKARRAIADAQRKRWANVRSQKKAAASASGS